MTDIGKSLTRPPTCEYDINMISILLDDMQLYHVYRGGALQITSP